MMKLKKCLTASILILGITVLSTTPAMAANIVKRNAAAHLQEQGNWRLDERGWWFEKAGGGYARAEWRSPVGKIRSAWEYREGKLVFDFTVPVPATIELPDGRSYTVPEGEHHDEILL